MSKNKGFLLSVKLYLNESSLAKGELKGGLIKNIDKMQKYQIEKYNHTFSTESLVSILMSQNLTV